MLMGRSAALAAALGMLAAQSAQGELVQRRKEEKPVDLTGDRKRDREALDEWEAAYQKRQRERRLREAEGARVKIEAAAERRARRNAKRAKLATVI